MTQRFVEFVMMQAQNAALFLGQIPNPKTGEAEINLDLARMFIDQLEMIQEKTRGNLTNEETMVLRNALSNLQMAFVEASASAGPQRSAQPEAPQPGPSQPAEQPISAVPEQSPSVASSESETESRKKFTKSYGP
jgi:hypothetical protein